MRDYLFREPFSWKIEKRDFDTYEYTVKHGMGFGGIYLPLPQKNYVFYRYHNGIYQQKPIPDWRIRNYFPENTSNDSSRNMYGEYRRIAIALLKRYGTLPGSEVKASGDLIEIKLGYRLPPSEEEFFKLYSWPVRYDFSSKLPPVFTRKLTRQIYPMFNHELE